jgi:hypothetical protein
MTARRSDSFLSGWSASRREARQPGHVAPRPEEAGDQPRPHRVAAVGHDDRHRLAHVPGRPGRDILRRHRDVGAPADQAGGLARECLRQAGPAECEREVPSLNAVELPQRGVERRAIRRRVEYSGREHPDLCGSGHRLRDPAATAGDQPQPGQGQAALQELASVDGDDAQGGLHHPSYRSPYRWLNLAHQEHVGWTEFRRPSEDQ